MCYIKGSCMTFVNTMKTEYKKQNKSRKVSTSHIQEHTLSQA